MSEIVVEPSSTMHSATDLIETRRTNAPRLLVEESATQSRTSQADQELLQAYSHIKDLLDSMLQSDDEFGFGIDVATYKDARSLANRLYGLKLPAPQIFSHGGDAVTFVWKKGAAKRLITSEDEYFYITELDADGKESVNLQISRDEFLLIGEALEGGSHCQEKAPA
ncbi:MAG: hypothetical protein H6883_13290 [Rhodobiaceae bacterium]|nr:hypothetical protein [Rhodobiaceae bacterium]MCC0057094.1 hypothetical protein [Rhodobiaceae bacterium]